MDFARVTASPRAFAIEGKTYQVGKLTPRGIGDLQAHLKDCVEDPRLRARRVMEGLPDAVQLKIWADACEDARSWPPDIGSDEAMAHLLSIEGQAKLLWVAFRQHTEGFTLDKARELSVRHEISIEEFSELMSLMTPKEIGDPKSRAATETDSATKSSDTESAA